MLSCSSHSLHHMQLPQLQHVLSLNQLFFDQNMIDGKSFRVNDTVNTNNIIISKYVANLLNLKVGDNIKTLQLNVKDIRLM